MNFRLFASTFVAIFIAELGDKTQLATLSLAADASERWSVFVGSALALVSTSALAVLGAEWLTRFIPIVWIHRLGGALLILLGSMMLMKSKG